MLLVGLLAVDANDFKAPGTRSIMPCPLGSNCIRISIPKSFLQKHYASLALAALLM